MKSRGLALRIVVLNPPEGVLFRVQRGKTDLETPDLRAGLCLMGAIYFAFRS